MTRKKVKLAFIVNDTARKASYNKRKMGFLKKVEELSILCGIDACAIVYGPYEPQPDIWPSPLGVQNVVFKFRSMTELEHNKKKFNQEDYLKQRVSKARDQLMKLKRANMENEMKLFMYKSLQENEIMFQNLSMEELNVLFWLIDQNLKDIGVRILEASQIISAPSPGQLQMAPPPQLAAPTTTRMDHGGQTGMTLNDADIIQRQLDMDLMLNGNLHDENGPNMLP
ncbi:agamous-like mads-box protein agl80-like [Trifolium pratense]|uniref:Agamous-like mads-box protein agl80-like n=2 Tax=Trifolium pratense TaxID=57577 RepID=A0A2K3LZB1_TRIPR|nr:agamous-like MADS-box protein AGL80 [Trifolium pratense]PNX83852.1 agamous-like mads-box protein agl80-like [Trifolium pratense]PNX89744.1 agamous-like mads-box protein agl80-like [Trifolium pratense]